MSKMEFAPLKNVHADNDVLAEADDICDLVERGHFDFNRPHEEVVADLLKVAGLCMQLRKWLMKHHERAR